MHKIKGPINYKSFKPNDIKFIPLEFTKKLNLNQILRTHPKGKEYAHLLEEHSQYPLFLDSAGEVLSMPPIINSDYTGKVTEKTKAVFIECSGFEFKYLMPSLNVIVAALVDRGGELQTVKVVYPEKEIVTPNLKLKKIKINWKYIEKRTGLSIGKKNIIKLLKQANYKVKDKGNNLELEYSSIRQDIMHPVDVVEDVTIRYGYNNIEPISPKLITTQKINKINLFNKKIANILIGTGSQEILSYTLTNKNNLIEKMNLKNIKVVEVDNPVSKNWSSFRTWITPCLMEFLSKNTNKEYPQQIFEIGEVVVFDKNAETKTKNPVRVAWAKADKKSDFTDAKQILDFLMNAIGLDYSIEEIKHDSFIEGRVGRVFVKNKSVAYVGEINPKVLSNFRIDMPVCTFELNLTEICKLVKK